MDQLACFFQIYKPFTKRLTWNWNSSNHENSQAFIPCYQRQHSNNKNIYWKKEYS